MEKTNIKNVKFVENKRPQVDKARVVLDSFNQSYFCCEKLKEVMKAQREFEKSLTPEQYKLFFDFCVFRESRLAIFAYDLASYVLDFVDAFKD